MSELRKRRQALENRVESMVSGDSEKWLRSFLIQQFLTQFGSSRGVSVTFNEVERLWDAGLIEKVSSLEGSSLMFVEGWSLSTARAALKVQRTLKGMK
jgi:hypothetical protein